MTTVNISVTGAGDDKLRALIDAMGSGPVLKGIGFALLQFVANRFKTRGDGQWRPLSSLTLAMRPHGGDVPLQDTGRYRGAFVSETGGPGRDYSTDEHTFVEVGSNVKTPSGLSLAAIHEYGTKPFIIRAKNNRHGLIARARDGRWIPFGRVVNHPGIPARPVLPDQSTAERLAVDTVDAAFKRAIGDGSS